ncbi:AzlD family protein [Neoroseomonas marina]|uniref:AzlD family protein n=1 Tax=Neoroseomonas marina TaxID=1232220 RepID=UPI0020071D25|nr:AzlD domain-containing protein [Neoroseomonas marina]
MTLRTDVLLAILGMALATYLCRAGGYALFRALRPPRFVEVMLQHLPGPIFIAYVAPALATQGVKGFAAAAAVVVTQATTRNLAAAIAVGVGALWLLGLVG